MPADQTTATVPNLIQGQPYEFRVKAVNKAGPGQPSDATDPVIAKPRKGKLNHSLKFIFLSIKHMCVIFNLKNYFKYL